jgi:hypothetical protein
MADRSSSFSRLRHNAINAVDARPADVIDRVFTEVEDTWFPEAVGSNRAPRGQVALSRVLSL